MLTMYRVFLWYSLCLKNIVILQYSTGPKYHDIVINSYRIVPWHKYFCGHNLHVSQLLWGDMCAVMCIRGVWCVTVSPRTIQECAEGSINCHKWEADNPHLFALELSSGPQHPSNSPAFLCGETDQPGVAVACRPDIKETLEAHEQKISRNSGP